MRARRLLVTIIFFVISFIACNNISPSPISPSPIPESTVEQGARDSSTRSAEPIGAVSNIRTQVYAGMPDDLELIEGKTELSNNEYVKVANGGKARLEFPGPLSLLLYNQTEMDRIKLEFDSDSNPRIKNRLIRGGLYGYVEPGSQLAIDLAFGVQVNVLGTKFFVLYDEDGGYITIGKFDGTLSVRIPGQGVIFLDDSEMIDINSAGILTRHLEMSFTPEQFDVAADACLSVIQGVDILRAESGIPLAGQTSAEVDATLTCTPMQSTEIIPNTEGCEQPKAYVKAETVKLREGPDLKFYSIEQYHAPDEFTILGHYLSWYHVQFPDGNTGWLYIDWISIPGEVNLEKICSILYRDLPPTPTDAPVEPPPVQPPAGPSCALYGQICGAGCCDGVPCTGGRCRYP